MRAIICKLTRAGFIAPLMIQSLLLALKKAKRFACASVIGAIGSTYISFQLECKWLEMSPCFRSFGFKLHWSRGMYLLRTKVMRKSECFLVLKQWNLIEWFDLASGPPKWSVVNISWDLESLVTIQTVCDEICRIAVIAYNRAFQIKISCSKMLKSEIVIQYPNKSNKGGELHKNME